MEDVFDNYPAGAAWDEMFDHATGPRPAYKQVHAALSGLSSADLRARADTLARSGHDDVARLQRIEHRGEGDLIRDLHDHEPRVRLLPHLAADGDTDIAAR